MQISALFYASHAVPACSGLSSYMRMAAAIREEMGCDPRNSDNVYVFINRRCTIIKMLHYERGFYTVYEKRPETGRFRKPVFDSKSGKYKISYADLVCLTEGVRRTEIRLPEEGYRDSQSSDIQ